MRAMLALIMRGRTHAITACAVLGVLSLLFPPLSYLSGAVAGLATLKQGAREGALVVAGAVLLAGAFALLTTGTPALALAVLAMSWAPAWLLAQVLATTRSQGTTLVAATALGVVAVLGLYAAVDDPVAWWRALLEGVFAGVLEGGTGSAPAGQVDAVIGQWAQRMTGFFGAGTTLGLMVTLLLARLAHAVLDNPGGFGREFRELRVGRGPLAASLVLGIAAMFLGGAAGGLANDLMGPVTVMLAFQGLAVAHGVARERGTPTGWLVAMYLLLVVPPNLALPVLAVVGLVDGWLDFRARSRRSS